MSSDNPNWKLILIVLLVVALVAVGAAVVTFERVSMELVLILALVTVAASFALNRYIGGAERTGGKNKSPDKPA